MTDKELLELTAKAAGIEIVKWNSHDSPMIRYDAAINIPWNPITDDGDALRLAVKLKMNIDIVEEATGAGALVYRWCSEVNNGDPYAATRRAIVRAAAEVGKEKK